MYILEELFLKHIADNPIVSRKIDDVLEIYYYVSWYKHFQNVVTHFFVAHF